MTDINVGAITESLNYKADLDLKNTSLIQVVDAYLKHLIKIHFISFRRKNNDSLFWKSKNKRHL